MAFTEFCCRSGGSNLNAGSVDGGATEPATTPLVTYTGGDWNLTTGIYTAPVGAVMTEAVVGRFASVYTDGSATATSGSFLVGRIGNVSGRDITIHATARANFGTAQATSPGNKSMRIGGAWLGPNAAVSFPFNFAAGPLTNAALDTLRVNLKNEATYTITTPGLAHTVLGPVVFQGYTTNYGDLGKATIDGGNTGASYVLLTLSGSGIDRSLFADIIFQRNGATGSAAGVSGFADSRSMLTRCVVNSVRGSGFDTIAQANECEAYGCNQSNTASLGGFVLGTAALLTRCISHHHTAGPNAHGFYTQQPTATLLNCISANNSGSGLLQLNASSIRLFGSDFYANGVDGFRHLTANATLRIENCNFIGNTGYGINISTGSARGVLFNNGFGDNTVGAKNNTGFMEERDTVTYGAGATPWRDPVNGDFRISNALAKNAGRGRFTQTYSSWSAPNTIGYPDIGAAAHQDMSVQPTYGIGV